MLVCMGVDLPVQGCVLHGYMRGKASLCWGQGGLVKVTCVRKMADAAAVYCVFYLY